jgi:hypothetical protein
VSTANPHRVMDAGNTMLGSFPDAETAHEHAHDESRRPGARLPIEVEDREQRTSRFVWPDRCHSVRWMAVNRTELCPLHNPALPGPIHHHSPHAHPRRGET